MSTKEGMTLAGRVDQRPDRDAVASNLRGAVDCLKRPYASHGRHIKVHTAGAERTNPRKKTSAFSYLAARVSSCRGGEFGCLGQRSRVQEKRCALTEAGDGGGRDVS